MRPLPEPLLTLSIAQQGLLTHPQLAAHGLHRREIDLRVRRHDWQRISETVIATHALPLPRTARLWAAALHFDRCGLAGTSVLELSGLPTPRDERIHLIGPPTGRRAPMAGVVVHTDTTCGFVLHTPDRVRTDLAVAQAVRWALTDRQSVFFSTWAIQRGLVTIDQLLTLGSELPPSPGTAAMRRRLQLIDPGVHSIHEHDFAQECRRRGLPEPVRQRLRRDSQGRERYVDAEFTAVGGRLVVEIDGCQHLETVIQLDDALRANELALQGTTVLRIPAVALRLEPDGFFEQLRNGLNHLGRAA